MDDSTPMPVLHRMLWCGVVVICTAVAACAPGIDDSKSLSALKSANEGIVFLRLTYAGLPCRTGNVALATEPAPGRFELHKTLMVGGIAGSAAMTPRQVSLPAGTYHIGYVACQSVGEMKYMMGVGEHDGTVVIGNPRQSLAKFTVSAGEAVDVGQINLQPTDYLLNAATISVADITPDAMQRLRAEAPTLSSSLVTRLMTVTSPGQSYKIERMQLGIR